METSALDVLAYSLRRMLSDTTSFLSSADSMTLAILSSSMRNLKTASYIGFAMETFMEDQKKVGQTPLLKLFTFANILF